MKNIQKRSVIAAIVVCAGAAIMAGVVSKQPVKDDISVAGRRTGHRRKTAGCENRCIRSGRYRPDRVV